MIAGEVVLENFRYGFQNLELPLMNEQGLPLGGTAKLKDLVVISEMLTVRIRFREGVMYDEFAQKATAFRILIGDPNGQPAPRIEIPRL